MVPSKLNKGYLVKCIYDADIRDYVVSESHLYTTDELINKDMLCLNNKEEVIKNFYLKTREVQSL